MKFGKKQFRGIGFPAFACLSLCFFAMAPQVRAQDQQQSTQQSEQSQQTQTKQPPVQTAQPSLAHPGAQQQATAPAKPKVDSKEEAAFQAFAGSIAKTSAALDQEIQKGEDFLKSYPASIYRERVYALLSNEYYMKGQTDRFAQGEMDKMMANSDKALTLNPNDLTVLTLLGNALPKTDANAADFPQKLVKAESCNHRALDVLSKISKPATLSDDQFTKLKAQAASEAHGGLGLVYFREGKFQESTEELQKANDPAVAPDPTNYYVLGIDFEQMKKFDEAAKAYDSCAQIQSGFQDRCKQSAAQAKAKAGGAKQPPKP